MFEMLENRRLLSVNLTGAKLEVVGSADSDVIQVNQLTPVSFSVYENGISTVVTGNRIVKQIVVSGGAGDDEITLYGVVTAVATLNGDDGDDTLIGGDGADVINGGAGSDWVNYAHRQVNLRISLNGIADDGSVIPACERDNVMPDVENVIGGVADDVIVCQNTAVDNTVCANEGDDDVRGGPGNDLLMGAGGDDSLDGGAGNDYLAGNGGSDYMLGGDGDDTIEANDGAVDTVIGGLGFDTCWADSTTVVDNVNAEDVFLI